MTTINACIHNEKTDYKIAVTHNSVSAIAFLPYLN